MASLTCASPREGFARALKAHWAAAMGRLIRRARDRVRRRPETGSAVGASRRCGAGSLPAAGVVAAPQPPKPAQACPPALGHAAPAQHPFFNLLATMSHELRTPLNAVIGFSDLMERELFGPLGNSRYQEYARYIRDSGDALLRAAEDALAMTTLVASASHNDQDRVGLCAIVVAAWMDLCSRSAARNVGLDLQVAPDILVCANARVMRQAFKHLLAAALMRARAGGKVRVAAVAAHGRVRIEVFVATAETCGAPTPGRGAVGAEELSLALARALFEVQGGLLTEHVGVRGWAAHTEVEHAVQGDFFARAC
ncbi:MAG TPA: HAMP domain-containing sensor histidine kinase [Hyphomicrobiaceae bacterium]|nr:HAMP domain-containing sensor histidine kinase [Hyphomicrobiaceae bacterium]